MATTAYSTTLPTLLDVANRTDPNGSIARIVELMQKESPFLQTMGWKEGNLPTGHKFTQRTALPSLAWRKLNAGVPASKSRTGQITEMTGQLAGMSKVDVDLCRINGNEAAFRQTEDDAFINAFHNDLESAFFYSSQKTDPDQVHGLSPRLDGLTSTSYDNQIVNSQISSSGSDQTSIWFVVWSPNTVYGIYPKGLPTGLQPDDLGKQLTADADGNEFTAWVTDWKWNVGFCVEDYRYVCRLCNIDTLAIAKTGKLLIEDMITAYHRIKSWSKGRGAIYCNRTIMTYLHLQAQDTVKNSTLTIENIGGMPVTRFMGVPIHMTDGLVDTEDVVS